MASSIPLSSQQNFWNAWNAAHREESVDRITIRQADVVEGWLGALGRRDLEILEVGCGAGWFCPTLLNYGRVTATDLSDQVLDRARSRVPEADFVAGDFMTLPFEAGALDAIVSLEVLSHVRDQKAFVRKLASHLKPNGHLMLSTQNRPVLQYLNRVPPPAPAQLRHWVSRHELCALLEPEFEVLELYSVSPRIGRGVLGYLRPSWLRRPAIGRRIETSGNTPNEQVGLALKTCRWLMKRAEMLGLGWTLMTLARKRVDR